MQLYRWRARNKSGKIFSGQLLAGSDREVAEYVQERHGYVINIKKTNNWYNYKQKFFGRKINAKSKESFFRKLATLLNSGMTLLRSLELIRGKSEGKLSEVCAALEKDLFKGLSFSLALRKWPKIFGHSDIKIVEAGETSGNLALLLTQLADFYQKEVENQRFLINACIYPCIVLALVFITAAYFLWKVLPLLVDLYITMQVEPNTVLNFLILVESLFKDFGWGIFVVVFIFLGQIYSKRENLRILLLRLPLVKACYHDLLEVRYCGVLAIMLSSGISLPLALSGAGETLPIALRWQSERLSRAVVQGMPVSKAAAICSEILGPTSLEFIAVGEESGNLAEMFLEASNITEEELQAKLKNLKALLEPLLMVFIALLVGCVVFSITSPIFGLITGLPDYK